MYPLKKFSLGELKGISSHIHKPIGDPILYRLITRPVCEFIQKRIPAKIMPNTITWLGLTATLLGALLAMTFDWSFDHAPRIIHLAYAVIMMFYIITDSLDGIHARNSKQSSPLGKILDHCSDSWTTNSSMVMLGSSMKTGFSPVFKCIMITTLIGFYIAAMVEKYTGSMVFSNFSGGSEALYLLAAFHLFAFFYPNTVPSYLKSSKFLNRLTPSLVIFCGLYIIVVFIDMLSRIKKVKPVVNMRDVGLSTVKFIVLMLLFTPFLIAKNVSRLYSTTYFAMIAQSYSLCYLEEYISSMSKLVVTNLTFFIQYAFLILKGINLFYWKSSRLEYLVFVLCTLHFAIRAGSTLLELARKLGVKLFNSKL